MLETSAGDITVYLAPNLSITIRASIDLANGHRIRSDFSEIRVTTEGGEWGPGTATAEGNLNGGGPIAESAHHHRRHHLSGQPLDAGMESLEEEERTCVNRSSQ